jgi:hypothetical protein
LSPAQLKARVAYFLATRKIWGKPLDSLLDGLIDPKTPIDFPTRLPNEVALLDFMSRLYTVHHLHTAQLTGALGGTYGWLPHELEFAGEAYRIAATTQGLGAPQHVGLSEYLFGLQVGRIPPPKTAKSFRADIEKIADKNPSSAEWSRFLNEIGQRKVQGYFGELANVVADADRATGHVAPDPRKDPESVARLLDGVARGGWEPAHLVPAAVTVGGLAVWWLADISVGGVVSAAYVASKAVPALRKQHERLDEFLNSLSSKRIARTRLLTIVGDIAPK